MGWFVRCGAVQWEVVLRELMLGRVERDWVGEQRGSYAAFGVHCA